MCYTLIVLTAVFRSATTQAAADSALDCCVMPISPVLGVLLSFQAAALRLMRVCVG
jgi:hypothetical protein